MKLAPLVVPLFLATAFAPAIFAQAAAKTNSSPRTQAAARPGYSRDLPAALVKQAKITEPVAAATALKAVPNGVIETMELEKEDGKFIYSYDLRTPGKSGIDEVHVDAMTGAVVSNVHETPADEKAEAAKDAKTRGAPAKTATKAIPPKIKKP